MPASFAYSIRSLCLFLVLVSYSVLRAEEPNQLSREELTEGWISLFDGESLYGWRAGSQANWEVKEGTITVSSGEKGLLRTTTQFSDYVLKVDFRCPENTNSGVFLRTRPKIGPADVARYCYELNIAPSDNPFPTGSLVARKKVDGGVNDGSWRTFEATLNGPSIIVKIDGKQILQYEDPHKLGRGFIALQFNEGEVSFRNIKLKPLALKSLFNGKDLSGWKTYPDMKSVFSVTKEGWLNVKDGKGQLETAGSYGDFVMQLECISHAKNLNSGIFFRCMPGDVMMGYESQIHNGYLDGDRTKPVDCGTGGIFRRQNARKVVSDDLQWFHKTLIAEGPHIATWINGVQVCDWTDKRKPHENPRKGLRKEPGTLMIQGHDPTTNLSFRNLSAGEMSQRFPE